MRAPRAKLYLSPRSLYQRPPGATTWQEQTGCHRRTDTLRHGPVIGHETDGDSHSPTSSLHLSLFAVGTSYWVTRTWTTDTMSVMLTGSVSLSPNLQWHHKTQRHGEKAHAEEVNEHRCMCTPTPDWEQCCYPPEERFFVVFLSSPSQTGHQHHWNIRKIHEYLWVKKYKGVSSIMGIFGPVNS